MLALAIISTVILGLLIFSFGTAVIDYDDCVPFLIILFLFGFVIMTIWILYAR